MVNTCFESWQKNCSNNGRRKSMFVLQETEDIEVYHRPRSNSLGVFGIGNEANPRTPDVYPKVDSQFSYKNSSKKYDSPISVLTGRCLPLHVQKSLRRNKVKGKHVALILVLIISISFLSIPVIRNVNSIIDLKSIYGFSYFKMFSKSDLEEITPAASVRQSPASKPSEPSGNHRDTKQKPKQITRVVGQIKSQSVNNNDENVKNFINEQPSQSSKIRIGLDEEQRSRTILYSKDNDRDRAYKGFSSHNNNIYRGKAENRYLHSYMSNGINHREDYLYENEGTMYNWQEEYLEYEDRFYPSYEVKNKKEKYLHRSEF